ncbi:YicC/YloC family endoribonuclease [Breznakiella homolactica]|nr:YicC/YloC family endoribonuclease [Breznakiella homolactica]
MTGYGYEEKQDGKVFLAVEIKGYNNRYLEIYVNLPSFLSSLEARVREYVSSRCRRGKIEIWVRVKELDADIRISVNQGAAKAYYEAINSMAASLGMGETAALGHILAMEGVLNTEKNRDAERYWEALEPLLAEAFAKFETERIREGVHTQEDILSHIGFLEKAAERVAAHGPDLERNIKENIKSRFEELLGDAVDEGRILAETAVLLMKYTISEEISRLSAHLGEFRAEAERNPAPGKKLDFLCQEINREINTIGSKSPVLDVSREVVAMKDALENIREQLRNVE